MHSSYRISEKKSRFIANICHVDTVEEAEEKEIIIENRKYKGENLERYNKILEATPKAPPKQINAFPASNKLVVITPTGPKKL